MPVKSPQVRFRSRRINARGADLPGDRCRDVDEGECVGAAKKPPEYAGCCARPFTDR
jgi:hypothetical protein